MDTNESVQRMAYWRAKKSLVVLTMRGHSRLAACITWGQKQCTNSWKLHLVDPKTMEVSTLYEADGGFYGGATSLAVVGDSVVVGSELSDRAVLFK